MAGIKVATEGTTSTNRLPLRHQTVQLLNPHHHHRQGAVTMAIAGTVTGAIMATAARQTVVSVNQCAFV